eukprot:gene510-8023_t
MNKTNLCFILFITLFAITLQKRILFYSAFISQSHNTFPIELARNLSIDHEIIYVSGHKYESWFKGTNVKFISTKKEIEKIFEEGDKLASSTTSTPKSLFTLLTKLYPIHHDEFSKLIEELKPDLIFTDEFLTVARDILAEKKIKTVLFSSGPESISGVHDESFIGNVFFPVEKELLKNYFWLRLKKILIFPYMLISSIKELKGFYEIRRKHGHQVSMNMFEDIKKYPIISVSFLPFSHPEKKLPLIKMTGGTIRSHDLKIKTELSKWLDEREKDGVVYIALGSAAKLDKKQSQRLMKGILNIPKINLLFVIRDDMNFEINEEEFKEFKNRIRIERWVNQQGVLSHKAIKIFLSHCGYQSIIESLSFNKPILGLGLIRDQILNAMRISELKIGLKLSRDGFTREEVSNKIRDILDNYVEYVERVKRLNGIRKSYGGIKTAVEYINYILEFGTEDLIPENVTMLLSF